MAFGNIYVFSRSTEQSGENLGAVVGIASLHGSRVCRNHI